jgi:hypothetical protein
MNALQPKKDTADGLTLPLGKVAPQKLKII